MKVKITCKQAVDYISRKEEKKLGPMDQVLLWKHLAICRFCRMFTSQNKTIIKALSGFEREHDYHLPEENKRRILEAAFKGNA